MTDDHLGALIMFLGAVMMLIVAVNWPIESRTLAGRSRS